MRIITVLFPRNILTLDEITRNEKTHSEHLEKNIDSFRCAGNVDYYYYTIATTNAIKTFRL